ncbi:hypothetical protein [Gillisia hiemivivida]|nr:hypothetical protein [Gillisia hiemivivida]
MPWKNAIEIEVEDLNSKTDSYPEINIIFYPMDGKNFLVGCIS